MIMNVQLMQLLVYADLVSNKSLMSFYDNLE